MCLLPSSPHNYSTTRKVSDMRHKCTVLVPPGQEENKHCRMMGNLTFTNQQVTNCTHLEMTTVPVALMFQQSWLSTPPFHRGLQKVLTQKARPSSLGYPAHSPFCSSINQAINTTLMSTEPDAIFSMYLFPYCIFPTLHMRYTYSNHSIIRFFLIVSSMAYWSSLQQ